MLDGYMLVQAALLLLAAVALGVALGRYVWPHRPLRPAAGPAATTPDAGIPGHPDGQVARDTNHAAMVANAHARAEYAEARTDLAEARIAHLEARLTESQSMLREARRQLRQADVELVRMRVRVRELADHNETEMGRLESGAIAALDATIAAHREQVAGLEERLRAAESTAEDAAQELIAERRRSAQLQSALNERYQHIATLMSEREQ